MVAMVVAYSSLVSAFNPLIQETYNTKLDNLYKDI